MISPQPRWGFLLLVLLSCSSLDLGVGLTLDGVFLLTLKYSVLSDPLGVLSSWNYDDATPCSWNGVICAAVDDGGGGGGGVTSSRVISLVLPNANLLGSIPGDLGLIEHLRHLDLSGNSLNGSLPSSLFNASELRVLSLADNEISGEIPDLFGNVNGLESLNFSDNSLAGTIPESLTHLRNLTVVSLSNNYLVGNLVRGYPQAEVVDLSSNLVTGTLPEDGFGGESIRYLNLSGNRLTGEIPASFGLGFSENVTMDLSFNNLSGAIPPVVASIAAENPTVFAGNAGLCGKPLKNLCSIPSTLSNRPPNGTSTSFPRDSPPAFAAIPKSVSGGTTVAASGSGQSTAHLQKESGMKPIAIAGIIVGDLAGIALLFMVFFLLYHLKKKKKMNRNQQERDEMILKPMKSTAGNAESEDKKLGIISAPTEKKPVSKLSICIGSTHAGSGDDTSETTASETEGDENRTQNNDQKPEQKKGLLVTVDGERELELETLLKASAYILGATGYSIVYKAVLADGTVFAVRRIENSGIAEKFKDFESHVRSIAKLRHQNLVRLRGFYWGSDEKLLIHDFAVNGNLANITYKKHGSLSPFYLPWDVRLRIIKGVARGLAYLHDRKAVHGNLKPTNILLGHDMEPMIGDFGLDRLNPNSDDTNRPESSFRHFGSKRSTLSHSSLQDASPSPLGGTGSNPYQAPESMKNLKPNLKWDVYSFGIVLLELLTGRVFDDAEIVDWNSIVLVPEERNRVVRLAEGVIRGEVVGKEEALLNCFKLGFICASYSPQKRPSMKDAAQLLDKITSSSS